MKRRLIYDVLHNFSIKHKWSFRKSFLMEECSAKFEIGSRGRDLVKDLNRDIKIPAKFKTATWDLGTDTVVLPVYDAICKEMYIRQSELWPPFNLSVKRVRNIIYSSMLKSFNQK